MFQLSKIGTLILVSEKLKRRKKVKKVERINEHVGAYKMVIWLNVKFALSGSIKSVRGHN